MKGRIGKSVAVSLATVAVALLIAPSALAGGESRDFRIRTKEYKFQGVPSALRPGIHDVTNDNHGNEDHVLFVFQLNRAHQDDSTDQILDALRAHWTRRPPNSFISEYTTGSAKGQVFAEAGTESQPGPVDLRTPGRYVYFCPIPTAGGIRHFNLGMIGFIKTRP